MHRSFQLAFETVLGTCGVRWSERGITRVLLPGSRALSRQRPDDPVAAPPPVAETIAGIVGLLRGERRDLAWVVLDERDLEDFPRLVYAATRRIGVGCTASYGEIALAIGQPAAAREVGAALGGNPFPIIVPCHRVLAATGALHGFSAPGGIATKRRMLEIENAPGFRQVPLFS